MTPAKLNSLINIKCGTNDTTFTQADKLILINIFKDEISSRIVELNVGYFLVPTPFDLVLNQREYGFPDDMLNRIHKLEIKFAAADARQPAEFIKDYFGSETESEITKNFTSSIGEFAYTIRRKALMLLSGTIPAVTGGGRLWYTAYPADLANLTEASVAIETDPTTTTFGFPRQFHELLARYVSIEWKGAQPKPLPLSKKELEIEKDMATALAGLSHIDSSAEYIGNSLPDRDTGNAGWNY